MYCNRRFATCWEFKPKKADTGAKLAEVTPRLLGSIERLNSPVTVLPGQQWAFWETTRYQETFPSGSLCGSSVLPLFAFVVGWCASGDGLLSSSSFNGVAHSMRSCASKVRPIETICSFAERVGKPLCPSDRRWCGRSAAAFETCPQTLFPSFRKYLNLGIRIGHF